MKRLAILTLFICLVAIACGQTTNLPLDEAISRQLTANDFLSVDFAKMGNETWTRVCFLGPYNENSADMLGFDWHVADHTNVLKSDGHSVVILATQNEVIDFVAEPRNQADFSALSGQCVPRNEAQLVKSPMGQTWQIQP